MKREFMKFFPNKKIIGDRLYIIPNILFLLSKTYIFRNAIVLIETNYKHILNKIKQKMNELYVKPLTLFSNLDANHYPVYYYNKTHTVYEIAKNAKSKMNTIFNSVKIIALSSENKKEDLKNILDEVMKILNSEKEEIEYAIMIPNYIFAEVRGNIIKECAVPILSENFKYTDVKFGLLMDAIRKMFNGFNMYNNATNEPSLGIIYGIQAKCSDKFYDFLQPYKKPAILMLDNEIIYLPNLYFENYFIDKRWQIEKENIDYVLNKVKQLGIIKDYNVEIGEKQIGNKIVRYLKKVIIILNNGKKKVFTLLLTKELFYNGPVYYPSRQIYDKIINFILDLLRKQKEKEYAFVAVLL